MRRIFKFFSFTKRQKFVVSVLILSIGLFISEFTSGVVLIATALALSLLTVLFLYLSLRGDLRDKYSYPIFILPFFFTLSFVLFYPLVPARFLTKVLTTSLFILGTYSLFLTQNIYAVSAIRTINLMRSARIVSFVISIVVLFLLSNVIFSLRLPLYLSPVVIFIIVFFLNFQSLWTYSPDKAFIGEALSISGLISLCVTELAIILNLWPVTAAIYSIFITGIFYSYSGLMHAWAERRLFKGVLWEYIWVGFLAVLILIFFSKWGIF